MVTNRLNLVFLFLEDIQTMNDQQLVLSYGRFYPDYLGGDLTEVYDLLCDHKHKDNIN